MAAQQLAAQQTSTGKDQATAKKLPNTVDKLMADGHYLRAERMVREALARNPNDLHSLVQQSILQWAFYRDKGFLATAQKAVSVDDNSAEAHAQLSNAMGEELANSTLGFMARLNAARLFRKEAERALQLNPNNTDALQDMAEYYWHAPAVGGGDKAKAQQLVDQIARIDPERGYSLRAEFAADEPDKAKRQMQVEGVWKQAVSALPSSYAMRVGLAEAYVDEGGGRLALADVEGETALLLDASRAAAYRVLAEAHAKAGRWTDLDAVLQRSRAAVPDDLSAEYQAAAIIATEDAGQMGRAETCLRDYLKQPAEGREPTLAAAHWQLGLVLEKEGRKAEAINEVQTAVSMDPALDGAKKDLKRLRQG